MKPFKVKCYLITLGSSHILKFLHSLHGQHMRFNFLFRTWFSAASMKTSSYFSYSIPIFCNLYIQNSLSISPQATQIPKQLFSIITISHYHNNYLKTKGSNFMFIGLQSKSRKFLIQTQNKPRAYLQIFKYNIDCYFYVEPMVYNIDLQLNLQWPKYWNNRSFI